MCPSTLHSGFKAPRDGIRRPSHNGKATAVTDERAQAIDSAIRDAIENHQDDDGGWLRAAGTQADADLPALQRRFYKMLSEHTVTLGSGLAPQLVK